LGNDVVNLYGERFGEAALEMRPFANGQLHRFGKCHADYLRRSGRPHKCANGASIRFGSMLDND
jgi:hypothetical protein